MISKIASDNNRIRPFCELVPAACSSDEVRFGSEKIVCAISKIAIGNNRIRTLRELVLKPMFICVVEVRNSRMACNHPRSEAAIPEFGHFTNSYRNSVRYALRDSYLENGA